jgi:hypothetical protein
MVEEVAREVHVFGGDPHLAVVAQPERGCDVVEVGHGTHIDPRLRHRDHHVGEAEAELGEEHHALVRVGHALAHQVLAGDAEMGRALRELRGDFRRRQIRDLGAVETRDRAAIVARAARLHELQPRGAEQLLGLLLQAALGGHGENERAAHAKPPMAESRSIHTAKPTAGIGVVLPSLVSMPS